MIRTEELSSTTWKDFEALFAKHKGVRGGCWCTFHRCSSTTHFEQMNREERRKFHQELTMKGEGYGLLLYDENVPVAWCQFGPANAFPRYDRGRDYTKLTIADDWKPQWRISCIFVDKDCRRKGLSHIALSSAIQLIRKKGGGVVEAFPFDIPGAKRPSYTGSVAMYMREGFHEVARLGKNTVLMRCKIDT
ncbi:MAG: hypothetical protein R6W96_02460 [Clostridia bacterium]